MTDLEIAERLMQMVNDLMGLYQQIIGEREDRISNFKVYQFPSGETKKAPVDIKPTEARIFDHSKKLPKITKNTDNTDNSTASTCNTQKGGKNTMITYADGSFRTRKNGLMEYRFYNNIDEIRSVYGRSRQECFDKRTGIISGKTPDKKSKRIDLFGDWLAEWKKTYKDGRLGAKADKEMTRYITKEIVPTLGDIPLKKVSLEALQRFFNGFAEHPNTQKKLLMVIRPCLEKAVKLGKIKVNPCEDVELQEHSAEHYRALEYAEQQGVLDSLPSHYRAFVRFAMCTGIRCSRLFSLTFQEVDFDLKRITILKKQKKGRNETYSIPFLPDLFDGISIPSDKSQKVFPCVSNTTLKRLLNTAYSTLGIAGANIHSFRHTFISVLYNVGCPIKKAQRWAGHSTFEMTSNVYCHLLKPGESDIRDYLARLNATFDI